MRSAQVYIDGRWRKRGVMSEDSTPADLLDLKMMPAWVNEPARTNDYADHHGRGRALFRSRAARAAAGIVMRVRAGRDRRATRPARGWQRTGRTTAGGAATRSTTAAGRRPTGPQAGASRAARSSRAFAAGGGAFHPARGGVGKRDHIRSNRTPSLTRCSRSHGSFSISPSVTMCGSPPPKVRRCISSARMGRSRLIRGRSRPSAFASMRDEFYAVEETQIRAAEGQLRERRARSRSAARCSARRIITIISRSCAVSTSSATAGG